MKYYVHIKIQERPIGTGFLGAEISSIEELKDAIKKYGIYKEKDGSRHWGDPVKISFTTASIVDAVKESGYKQCQENGGVNLFSFVPILQQCPYRDIDVFYRHDGWLDDNGEIFRWIIARGEDYSPVYDKLIDVLNELGIEL